MENLNLVFNSDQSKRVDDYVDHLLDHLNGEYYTYECSSFYYVADLSENVFKKLVQFMDQKVEQFSSFFATVLPPDRLRMAVLIVSDFDEIDPMNKVCKEIYSLDAPCVVNNFCTTPEPQIILPDYDYDELQYQAHYLYALGHFQVLSFQGGLKLG